MDYQKILDELHDAIKAIEHKGKVASYIPELADVHPDKLGVHLTTVDGENYGCGDSEEKFSIQSIAKVLSLVMAYELEGETLWRRVDVEPPGTPFNSLVQLEHDLGKPRNPMINAGALVICDILMSRLEKPKKEILAFIRKIAGDDTITYDETVAKSEMQTGYRNLALLNLMKAFKNIDNGVWEVFELYCNLCSIEMNCAQLSKTFLLFAADGTDPKTGERFLTGSKTKRINSIMQLCGFYDEAGEFSFKVGLPGKSGVGGGIVAVLPAQYSIAVWSPPLNAKGNSYKGMEFLERFTTETEHSIF
ncbi:MAG: glutaminase [Leeuwenhoekiella sp.]